MQIREEGTGRLVLYTERRHWAAILIGSVITSVVAVIFFVIVILAITLLGGGAPLQPSEVLIFGLWAIPLGVATFIGLLIEDEVRWEFDRSRDHCDLIITNRFRETVVKRWPLSQIERVELHMLRTTSESRDEYDVTVVRKDGTRCLLTRPRARVARLEGRECAPEAVEDSKVVALWQALRTLLEEFRVAREGATEGTSRYQRATVRLGGRDVAIIQGQTWHVCPRQRTCRYVRAV